MHWGIEDKVINICKLFSGGSKNGKIYTVNFHMFKLNLKKAEEPQIKLPTSAGSSRKQESSRKISILLYLLLQSLWLCGSQ